MNKIDFIIKMCYQQNKLFVYIMIIANCDNREIDGCKVKTKIA